MKKRELASALVITASPKILSLVTKFIRAKLSAIILGPTGVGVIDQIQSVANKIKSLVGLSISVGAKKLILENIRKKDTEAIGSSIRVYGGVILFLTLLTLGVILFNRRGAESFFFGDSGSSYFYFVLILFPLLLINGIPRTVLTSFLKYKFLARVEMIILIVSLILFVPAVIYYELRGAIAVVLINAILFLVFLSIGSFKTLKEVGLSFKDIFIFRRGRIKLVKELFAITGILSILSLLEVVLELWIRGRMINELGLKEIGLYAPIIAWSGLIGSLFMPLLSQYIFPKIGMHRKDSEYLSSLINQATRLVVLILFPLLLVLSSFSVWLIEFMYNSEFISSSKYMTANFMGLLFFTLMSIQKQFYIPTGRIYWQVPLLLLEFTAYFMIIQLFIVDYGLWAITAKYAVVPIGIFFIQAILFKIKFRIGIPFGTWVLIGFAFLVFAGSIYLQFSGLSHYFLLATLPMLYFFLDSEEKNQLKTRIEKLKKRISK